MSSIVAHSAHSVSYGPMTDQLRKVLIEVEQLSAEDQNLIAGIIMREVSKAQSLSEAGGDEEESLQALLQEARQELHSGQTKLMSKDCVIQDN